MSELKPASDDGTLVVVEKPTNPNTQAFGPAHVVENVVGYEGDQRLTIVHLQDGTTLEFRDIMMVRTWHEPEGG